MLPSRMRHRLLTFAATLAVACVAVLAPAPQAQAAPPDEWGFAFVDNPTVPLWTALNPAYQATSPVSPTVEGGKLSPGRFDVKFVGLALGGLGNVHVTAVNKKGYFCETVRWGSSGSDEIVGVQCFAPGGVKADTPFTVMWTVNSAVLPSPAGSYATVQYGAGGSVVQLYNSTGAGVTATPLGTGVVAVRFEKVGVGSQLTGDLQVTALNRQTVPRRCKVGAWDDQGTDIIAIVYCFDGAGVPTDADFTASYHRERSVISPLGPKYFGYVWSVQPLPPNAVETNFNDVFGGFGANAVTITGPHIVVVFPQILLNETHVQATAFGADPNYCTIAKLWSASGTDILAHVVCFDPAGNGAQDNAFVTITNRG
jgi:hypothetical protein